MSYVQVKLTDRPGSKLGIGQALFGATFREEHLDAFQIYFDYYIDELRLLRTGISEETWQINGLATSTYEDIFHIINVLRNNGDCQRPEIRSLLRSRFTLSDDIGLDRSINLAIRLWLMRIFFQNLFPRSRWQITAQSSRLGPHFTAAFMQRVCGLEIEWTTSLHDHLRLDRRRKALKIFPYKCHVQALIDSYKNVDGQEKYDQSV